MAKQYLMIVTYLFVLLNFFKRQKRKAERIQQDKQFGLRKCKASQSDRGSQYITLHMHIYDYSFPKPTWWGGGGGSAPLL